MKEYRKLYSRKYKIEIADEGVQKVELKKKTKLK